MTPDPRDPHTPDNPGELPDDPSEPATTPTPNSVPEEAPPDERRHSDGDNEDAMIGVAAEIAGAVV